MKITIEIDAGEARVTSSGKDGASGGQGAGDQAAGGFTGATEGQGRSDHGVTVPADLAARAALVGARSAGPAPTAEELGLGEPGTPGFPPTQVGAPRESAANAPTSATPADTSAGAAPSWAAGDGAAEEPGEIPGEMPGEPSPGKEDES